MLQSSFLVVHCEALLCEITSPITPMLAELGDPWLSLATRGSMWERCQDKWKRMEKPSKRSNALTLLLLTNDKREFQIRRNRRGEETLEIVELSSHTSFLNQRRTNAYRRRLDWTQTYT